MANYLKSGPCTKCGSSDARAEYSDGTAYCFACSGYTGGALKDRLKPRKSMEKAVKVIDTSEWQYSIPKQARDWLGRYGITDSEIGFYGIRWNPKLSNKQWDGDTGALAMPIYENGRVVCVSYRLFDSDKTKSVTIGYRTYAPIDSHGSTPAVVIVEDFVSALKVNRFFHCVPLLGSSLPDDALLRLSKAYTSVLFWLDVDKTLQASGMAQKAAMLGMTARTISTELDPKDQTDSKIQELLYNRHNSNKEQC